MHRDGRTAHVVRGILNGTLIGVAAGVVLGLAVMASRLDTLNASDRSTYVQKLEHLHHCWTHDAPSQMQGQVPGGVVLRPENSQAPVYRHTPGAVASALAHVFHGAHAGMVVFAFCAGGAATPGDGRGCRDPRARSSLSRATDPDRKASPCTAVPSSPP